MKGKALARLCCVFNAEPTFLKPSSIGFLFSGEAAWGVLHALQTPPPCHCCMHSCRNSGVSPSSATGELRDLGLVIGFLSTLGSSSVQ